MPYRRHGKRRRYTRKKRTLAPKNIRRRTGARAQSKQIASLSRKVSMLTKSQFETFHTNWERISLPIETVAGAGIPYICPIPFNAMGPFPGSNATSEVSQWRDSLAIASQAFYVKNTCFNVSEAVQNSPMLYHKNCVIKYQMACNEPNTTKVWIGVVRPKKATAQQLIADNNLNAGPVPYGPRDGALNFVNGVDYVVNSGAGASGAPDTYFGTMINLKRWDVLYSREHAFGLPSTQGLPQSVVVTNGSNNTSLATGTIKLPGIGRITSVSQGGAQSTLSNACQLGLVDQEAHTQCFLVCITNGVVADGETIVLGMNVLDTYRATV